MIEALRREVDALDDELVMLLARRRDVVARLGAEKRSVGLPATDAAREAALRVRWAERARETGLPEAIALAVLDAVLAHSRAHVATVIDEG